MQKTLFNILSSSVSFIILGFCLDPFFKWFSDEFVLFSYGDYQNIIESLNRNLITAGVIGTFICAVGFFIRSGSNHENK